MCALTLRVYLSLASCLVLASSDPLLILFGVFVGLGMAGCRSMDFVFHGAGEFTCRIFV